MPLKSVTFVSPDGTSLTEINRSVTEPLPPRLYNATIKHIDLMTGHGGVQNIAPDSDLNQLAHDTCLWAGIDPKSNDYLTACNAIIMVVKGKLY